MARVAVLPGDGVGKEVTREAARVLRSVRPDIELVEWPHGADRFLDTGETITDAEFAELRERYDAILRWATRACRATSTRARSSWGCASSSTCSSTSAP